MGQELIVDVLTECAKFLAFDRSDLITFRMVCIQWEHVLQRHRGQILELLKRSNNWSTISCGDYHTAYLDNKGNVFTFGCYNKGQLGHGNRDDALESKQVKGLKLGRNVNLNY